MHYDRSYAGLDGEAKRDKAIADIKDWLGSDEMFGKLVMAVELSNTLEVARFYCEFVGVQGYPAQAMWERYNTQETHNGKV